jgi:hypothetical protein
MMRRTLRLRIVRGWTGSLVLHAWVALAQAQTINYGNVQFWTGAFPPDLREGGVEDDNYCLAVHRAAGAAPVAGRDCERG